MNIRFVRFVDKYVGIPLVYFLAFIDYLRRIFSRDLPGTSVESILCIKYFGIGNIFLALPGVRMVRSAYPRARIHFLSLLANRDLIERIPEVDRFFFVDNESVIKFVLSTAGVILQLRKIRIDCLLDYEQFSRFSTVLGYIIGARRRIGFDTPGQGRGVLYTRPVAYPVRTHMLDTFARVSVAAGESAEPMEIKAAGIPLEENEWEETEKIVADAGADGRKAYVCIHPGSGENMMTQRRWPPERFAALADYLVETFGAQVLYTGVSSETPLIADIRSQMMHEAFDVSGRLDIGRFCALVSRSALVISNDTSTVHIASAYDVPAIAFFGPNCPELYGPTSSLSASFYRSLPCSPCITNYNSKIKKCGNPICIRAIPVEDVISCIEEKFRPVFT